MPYIPIEDRIRLYPRVADLFREIKTRGELNYCITLLLLSFVHKLGICYDNLNDTQGIAECVAKEFYRKHVAPYEDVKEKKNGEVTYIND